MRIEMVVPSQSVATTLRQLDPRLAAVPMPVIGHGMDMDAPRIAYPTRAAGERMRIVVLGRLSPQKGIALLRDAAPGLAPVRRRDDRRRRWKWRGARKGVWLEVRSRNTRLTDLPWILGEIAPHAVLLASVVPETFSYTLSEACGAGNSRLLASALGSFKERIVEGESGFLFEPGQGLPGRSDSQTSFDTGEPGDRGEVPCIASRRTHDRADGGRLRRAPSIVGPSRRALPRGHWARDRH